MRIAMPDRQPTIEIENREKTNLRLSENTFLKMAPIGYSMV